MELKKTIDEVIEDGCLVCSVEDNNYRCTICNISCKGLMEGLSHLIGAGHRKVVSSANFVQEAVQKKSLLTNSIKNVSLSKSTPKNNTPGKFASNPKSPNTTLQKVEVERVMASKSLAKTKKQFETLVKKAIEKGHLILVSDSSYTHKCTRCNIYLNGLDSAISHLLGKNHQKAGMASVGPLITPTKKMEKSTAITPKKERIDDKFGSSFTDEYTKCNSHPTGLNSETETSHLVKKSIEKGHLILVSDSTYTHKCTMCNIHLNGIDSAVSHLLGKDHQYAGMVKKGIKEGYLILVSDSTFNYRCMWCNIDFKYLASAANHLFNKKHKNTFKAYQLQVKDAIKSGHLVSVSQNPVKYSCIVCNVPLGPFHNAVQHLEEKQHKKSITQGNSDEIIIKVKGAIKSGHLVSVSKNPVKYSCSVCNVKLGPFRNAVQHLEGKQHKTSITSTHSSGVNSLSNSDQIKVKDAMKWGHLVSLPGNPVKYYCLVCKVTLGPFYNAVQHLVGKQHKTSITSTHSSGVNSLSNSDQVETQRNSDEIKASVSPLITPSKITTKKMEKYTAITPRKEIIDDKFGKYLMSELNNMESSETAIAIKFINEVLYNVKLGQLTNSSRLLFTNE